MTRRRITVGGMLRLMIDYGDMVLPPTSIRGTFRWFYDGGSKPIKELDEYFPSVVERATDKLLREGLIEKTEDERGVVIKVTEKGRTKILFHNLYAPRPKSGEWDGKWRLVYFDIAETDKRKRDILRRYICGLGMKQLQQSVWISPYDVSEEIKYAREVLGVPHVVKLAVIDEIENEAELKGWFGL